MKPTKILNIMLFVALAASTLFMNACGGIPPGADGISETESALTVGAAPPMNPAWCVHYSYGICDRWQPRGNYGGSIVCDTYNGPVWLGHVNLYTAVTANDMGNYNKCAEWHSTADEVPAMNYGWYNRKYSFTPPTQVGYAIRSMWVADNTWVLLCDINHSTCQYYESYLDWGNQFNNIPIGLGYYVQIGTTI